MLSCMWFECCERRFLSVIDTNFELIYQQKINKINPLDTCVTNCGLWFVLITDQPWSFTTLLRTMIKYGITIMLLLLILLLLLFGVYTIFGIFDWKQSILKMVKTQSLEKRYYEVLWLVLFPKSLYWNRKKNASERKV